MPGQLVGLTADMLQDQRCPLQCLRLLRVVATEVMGFAPVGEGVGEGLAPFQHEQIKQFRLMLFQQTGETSHDVRSFRHWPMAPIHEGLPRLGIGLMDRVNVGKENFSEFAAVGGAVARPGMIVRRAGAPAVIVPLMQGLP